MDANPNRPPKTTSATDPFFVTPSLLRRLGSLLYDALALIALWLLASALFTAVFGRADSVPSRWLLQAVCLSVVAGYFLWCWTRGGQTLAMKTWRIRLVAYGPGSAVPLVALIMRFVLAGPSILLGGVGLWWALVDREGQFLHDRLARTRLVRAE